MPETGKGRNRRAGRGARRAVVLVSGSEKLRLEFDCGKCEMHVVGKMKKHILKSPLPSVAPVLFHDNRQCG